MIAEEIGEASASTSITNSTKSAKLLSGINQYSLWAYTGQKINEDIPDMFCVLDSNENLMTKVQALKNWQNKTKMLMPWSG